jgi:hypothetical protein
MARHPTTPASQLDTPFLLRLRGNLMQLDGVTVRVFDQDLRASGSRFDRAAEVASTPSNARIEASRSST